MLEGKEVPYRNERSTIDRVSLTILLHHKTWPIFAPCPWIFFLLRDQYWTFVKELSYNLPLSLGMQFKCQDTPSDLDTLRVKVLILVN
jgi:hypothetical protein